MIDLYMICRTEQLLQKKLFGLVLIHKYYIKADFVYCVQEIVGIQYFQFFKVKFTKCIIIINCNIVFCN